MAVLERQKTKHNITGLFVFAIENYAYVYSYITTDKGGDSLQTNQQPLIR